MLEKSCSTVQSAHSQGVEHIPTTPDQAMEAQGDPCPCSWSSHKKKSEVQCVAPLLLHLQIHLFQQSPCPLPNPSVVATGLSSK